MRTSNWAFPCGTIDPSSYMHSLRIAQECMHAETTVEKTAHIHRGSTDLASDHEIRSSQLA